MARTLPRTAGFYLSMTAGTIGAQLNGATAITIAGWIKLASTATNTQGDRLFQNYINAASTGVSLNVNSGAGGVSRKVSMLVRSVSTDALQSFSGTTDIPLSTWTHIAAWIDYSTKVIKVFINGVPDGTSGALTLANASYTNGTPTAPDEIAANATGTAQQLDADVAYVAIWKSKLSDADIALLGSSKYRPDLVQLSSMVEGWGIAGSVSPEPGYKSLIGATVNGTLPQASDPPGIVTSLGGGGGGGSGASVGGSGSFILMGGGAAMRRSA